MREKINPYCKTVNRSPQATDATVSGVLLGFPKTKVVSGWLAQSTYAAPSAQAAEDRRKHPPNTISIRFRNI
jgi:hypothetical protein